MVIVTELENTLWGIVLDGSKKVEVKSERPIHISMISLDTSVSSDEFVPVMVQSSETNKYLLCTLNKPSVLQQSVELELNSGEGVTFYLNCQKGSVNMTGYYITLPDSEEFARSMTHGQCDDELCEEDHGNLQQFYYNQQEGSGDESDEDEDEDDDDDDEEDGDGDEFAEIDDDSDDDDEEEEGDEDDDDDDDDDDEDDEDDEEDEEDEEEQATNGKKRKLTEANGANSKKLKNEKETKQELNKNKKSLDDKAKKEPKKDEKPPKLVPSTEKAEAKDSQKLSQPRTIGGGVIIKDVKLGHGPEAKKGKTIHVYYSGKLKQNGKQFDACIAGKPFKFRLGAGQVIKGWDIGFENMKVGGKRTITVPPHMGYGSRRMGNDIPANSTLVFDVELKAVS